MAEEDAVSDSEGARPSVLGKHRAKDSAGSTGSANANIGSGHFDSHSSGNLRLHARKPADAVPFPPLGVSFNIRPPPPPPYELRPFPEPSEAIPTPGSLPAPSWHHGTTPSPPLSGSRSPSSVPSSPDRFIKPPPKIANGAIMGMGIPLQQSHNNFGMGIPLQQSHNNFAPPAKTASPTPLVMSYGSVTGCADGRVDPATDVPAMPTLGFVLPPVPDPPPAATEWERSMLRRRVIAYEILETERTYLHHLNILTEVFLGRMRELGFDRTMLFTIFSNAEVIRGCHQRFFEKLRVRVSTWNDNSVLSDIFLNESAWIKLYKYYINNYMVSATTVKKCKEGDVRFKTFVTRTEKERKDYLGGLDMNSFLVVPVQRIPRYVLLLQDLLKWTPEAHPDYSKLKDALAYMKELADYVNERRRESEKQAELAAIQARITGFSGDVTLMPGRVFHRDFPVLINHEKSHMFLFSDIILVTKAEKKSGFPFKCLVQLKTTGLQKDDATIWRLLSSEGVLNCQLLADDAEAIIKTLEGCIDKARANLLRSAFVDELASMTEGSAQFMERQEELHATQKATLMRELVSSEHAYVEYLQHVYNVYLLPMKTLQCASCMLNSAGTFELAQEFEKLLEMHTRLLQELDVREREWTRETQVGDVFMDFDHNFRFYGHYTSSHGRLIEHLSKNILSTQTFAVWLRERESVNREDLCVLLEKPLGRIAEYYLKLQELLQYTRRKHADYQQLEAAVDAMQVLSDDLARKGTAKTISIFGEKGEIVLTPQTPRSPRLRTISGIAPPPMCKSPTPKRK